MIDVRCSNFQRMMKQFVLVRWCDQIEEWKRIRFKVSWICNVLFYNWQSSSIYWMHCSWRSHRYFSDWKFWFFNKNAKIPRYLPWFYMANVFDLFFFFSSNAWYMTKMQIKFLIHKFLFVLSSTICLTREIHCGIDWKWYA